MCTNYDESPAPSTLLWRKAQKEHTCFACREKIFPGDLYHITTQLFEDNWETYKHCFRCWTMTEEILDAGAEGVVWDLDCGDSWKEVFGQEPPESVAKLAFLTHDEAQKDARLLVKGKPAWRWGP